MEYFLLQFGLSRSSQVHSIHCRRSRVNLLMCYKILYNRSLPDYDGFFSNHAVNISRLKSVPSCIAV